MKKIFIKKHMAHAGKWIYEGYKKAWGLQGYESHYYSNFNDISFGNDPYYLMAIDSDIRCSNSMRVVEKAEKVFVYTQPNVFPSPWGTHPNFQCLCPDNYIKFLNNQENVHLWTFGDNTDGHTKWKFVHTVPLAFDSESYKVPQNNEYSKYDVCFVGGWANNGFNEKRQIMLKYFHEFMSSGLNCGFFVNRNLTHEQEVAVLYGSKVALNIHDAYQRILGHDTNERTFKSLGLNGLLVSDKVAQLEHVFPDVKTTMSPPDMVKIVKQYLSLSEKELDVIKQQNRQNILGNHCYTHRVEQFLLM